MRYNLVHRGRRPRLGAPANPWMAIGWIVVGGFLGVTALIFLGGLLLTFIGLAVAR